MSDKSEFKIKLERQQSKGWKGLRRYGKMIEKHT